MRTTLTVVSLVIVGLVAVLCWPVVLYCRRREWDAVRREAEARRPKCIEDLIYE